MKKYHAIKSLTVLAAIFAISICSADNQKAAARGQKVKKEFSVIDSIHYPDKEDLSLYGMKDYTIFYIAKIWPKLRKAGNVRPEPIPSDKRITTLVKNKTADKSPVIYDIEHWPLDIRKNVPRAAKDDLEAANKKIVKASMDKMIRIIKTSKKVNPNVKYGYYSCIPLRDYWSPVNGDPVKIKEWQAANDYLQPLADSLDVICPSLYTFYDNHASWQKYAKANIAEAKRLAKGKPIYVYLWPKYHNSNKEYGNKFIDGDFWKLQLETVYNSGVDGIIIWDYSRGKAWNPQLPWWKETAAFLKRIKQ